MSLIVSDYSSRIVLSELRKGSREWSPLPFLRVWRCDMKLFKWLFCKHKYMPYQSYYETRKDGHKYLKHTWKCTKCGRVK